jgi:type I restriction enzyme, R subunit
VEQVLDVNLPDSYDRAIVKKKCDELFDMMLNYASNGQKWAAGFGRQPYYRAS